MSRLTLMVAAIVTTGAVLAPAAAGAAGGLDPSFGTSGEASYSLSFMGKAQSGNPEALALAAGAKIDVVGTASCGCGEWRILAARLLENGGLDPSFDSGGTVITSADPSEDEGTHVNVLQEARAGVVEADGAVVAVGERVQARLTASGQLDPTFENGSAPMNSFALVKLPSGDLLGAGEDPTEGDQRYPALERMLPDGAPDLSFGAEGIVKLPDHPGESVKESAQDALQLPSGEILLAGDGSVSNADDDTVEQFAWLAEVTANGSLDPSFGSGGIDYLPGEGGFGRLMGLAREPSGEIVLASEQPVGPEVWHAAVWGFSAGGARDPGFGAGGTTLIPIGEPGDSTTSSAVATDSQGDIYVAVNQIGPERLTKSAYISALTPTGQLDTAFAQGGLAALGRPSQFSALLVDAAGRLTVAGSSNEDLFFERLTGATSSGSTSTTSPAGASTPAKGVPLLAGKAVSPLRGSVSCKLVAARRGHKRIEQCTLYLRQLKGHWSSIEVLLARGNHRLDRKRLGHVHVPARFTFDVSRTATPLRWTVVLRQGKHLARASWTVTPK
jgi:uncharacterized delta-60 repeat protein